MLLKDDLTVGVAAAATGGGGLTVQMAVGIGNLVLVGLNILLALGGLYLVYLRVRRTQRRD